MNKPQLPPPDYPTLRKMKEGETRVFHGGKVNRSKVTSIQTRAGGRFHQTMAVLVSPTGEWSQSVTVVTCVERIV